MVQAGLMVEAPTSMWYVYMLKSNTRNWYYVGSTNDVERREKEHKHGLVKSTRNHRPLVKCFVRMFETEKEARLYEQKLKKCRREKEGIIKNIINS